jgi:hypothetical protein
MQTMRHCGHFRGRPRRHAVPQYVHARLSEVPSVLGDYHRLEAESWDGKHPRLALIMTLILRIIPGIILWINISDPPRADGA